MASGKKNRHASRVLKTINGRSLEEVANLFGDEINRHKHLSECPLCGESKHGSGRVYRGRYGQDRWSCKRCPGDGSDGKLHGGVADFIAFKLGLEAQWKDLDQAGKDQVIAWAYKHAKELASPPTRPPTPTPPEVRAPFKAEVAALWEAARPLNTSFDTMTWAVSRGLDVGVVVTEDLARQLPDGDLPEWAEPWRRRHHVLLPVYDETGEHVGLRARAVRGGKPKELQPAWGSGSSTGCVFANPHVVAMLRGDERPLMVVVTEGATDHLTWATTQPELAVIGIWSGAFTQDIADRIPDGATVVIRTDHDDAGNRYAKAIRRRLGKRVRVLRSRAPEGVTP